MDDVDQDVDEDMKGDSEGIDIIAKDMVCSDIFTRFTLYQLWT
jgi:hypothetical protein